MEIKDNKKGMFNMKITIDTKEDSHEELRKVIKMLSSLVGDEVMSNQGNLFGDSSSNGTSDMFSDNSTNSSEGSGGSVFDMFNNGSGSASSENTTEESEDKKEEKDDVDIDIPELQEYR